MRYGVQYRVRYMVQASLREASSLEGFSLLFSCIHIILVDDALPRFVRPSALLDLYTRFIVSPNFLAWLALKRAPLVHLMAPEPLPAVLGPGGKPIEEVEMIGMFFEVEVELQVGVLGTAWNMESDVGGRFLGVGGELFCFISHLVSTPVMPVMTSRTPLTGKAGGGKSAEFFTCVQGGGDKVRGLSGTLQYIDGG